MGWAPDPTKFSESLSEKKSPKGRLFALDNADKLETPRTQAKEKERRKRKSEKDESRRTEK